MQSEHWIPDMLQLHFEPQFLQVPLSKLFPPFHKQAQLGTHASLYLLTSLCSHFCLSASHACFRSQFHSHLPYHITPSLENIQLPSGTMAGLDCCWPTSLCVFFLSSDYWQILVVPYQSAFYPSQIWNIGNFIWYNAKLFSKFLRLCSLYLVVA